MHYPAPCVVDRVSVAEPLVKTVFVVVGQKSYTSAKETSSQLLCCSQTLECGDEFDDLGARRWFKSRLPKPVERINKTIGDFRSLSLHRGAQKVSRPLKEGLEVTYGNVPIIAHQCLWHPSKHIEIQLPVHLDSVLAGCRSALRSMRQSHIARMGNAEKQAEEVDSSRYRPFCPALRGSVRARRDCNRANPSDISNIPLEIFHSLQRMFSAAALLNVVLKCACFESGKFTRTCKLNRTDPELWRLLRAN